MPYDLVEKLKELKPYEPMCGQFRIRLDANESFLTPSKELMEDIQAAVSRVAFNRYPDPFARQVVERYAEFQGINPDILVAGNGSDELISLICTSFLKRGDKAITFTPDFSMYKFYCHLTENPVIELEKNTENLQIDIEQLIETANSQNVAAVFFSNPCNPTSLGLNAEKIREIVKKVNALVVLDEAYMDFWDQSLLNEVEKYDNLIILRTCSKAFGVASIRLGFAASNATIANALKKAKSPYNVNSVTQAIGEAVLSRKMELKRAIDSIKISRNQLYKGLKELEKEYFDQMKVYDTCTNFVFVRFADAEKVHSILCESGIAVRLLGDYLRITCGNEYDNSEVLSGIGEYLKKEVKK